jgi:hypothetical protein
MEVAETCEHILHCNHTGQVDTLCATIKLLDQWMKQCMTYSDLRDCIYEYAIRSSGVTIAEYALTMGTMSNTNQW